MPTLTQEAWAQIRADYEHTERPIEDICAEHGISSGTLRDRVRRWKWTRRRQPIPLHGPPLPLPALLEPAPPSAAYAPEPGASTRAGAEDATPAPPDIDAAPPLAPATSAPLDTSSAAVAQRLQGAVARVLPAIEATLARLATSTHPREMEPAARALGALTRTLRELNALLAQRREWADAEQTEYENLDQFRAELARKIDNMIASRPKPEGDDAGAREEAPDPDPLPAYPVEDERERPDGGERENGEPAGPAPQPPPRYRINVL